MTEELAGKVAIVTGGAGGIGRATAKGLVAAGAKVVIADIDVATGREVAEELGDGASFHETDVSDVDQVQAVVDHAVEHFGGLHIMFNNAGIGSPLKGFLADDLEDFSSILGVNLFGVIAGTQRAARHMKAQGGGVIINNASIAAISAGVGMISYRASKAAVVHATKCMAIDLAPHGIRVNCLAPAHIQTGITTYDMAPVLKYMQPLPRHAQPEDVADAVVFLASDRAAQITGIVLPIDGGTTAGVPYAQTKLIMSQLAAGATAGGLADGAGVAGLEVGDDLVGALHVELVAPGPQLGQQLQQERPLLGGQADALVDLGVEVPGGVGGQGPALRGDHRDRGAGVGRMRHPLDQAVGLEPVDDVGDRGRRDAQGPADPAEGHRRLRVGGQPGQHLVAGEGEVVPAHHGLDLVVEELLGAEDRGEHGHAGRGLGVPRLQPDPP